MEDDGKIHISRVTLNRTNAEQAPYYFVIKPQKNEILDVLLELEKFDLNVMDVSQRIKDKLLLQFPEIMKNL